MSGIAVARGLLRDGHDVTVFDQRPNVTAGGGAVTIWSNGATVLDQLGVDMQGAGQPLSSVRATTSSGRTLASIDLDRMVNRLGAPIRMVPRRILLERLLTGFPTDRIYCRARAVDVVSSGDGVRVEMEDGRTVTGDVLIGADGLHSVVRDVLGAAPAKPTGWCSWQGLVALPQITEPRVARMIIGEHGSLGLWPAGGTNMQWWFDLPWAPGYLRPQRPIEVIRRHFAGWSDLADEVLAALTDEDLAASPFPHYRHPVPDAGTGPVTLLGDAAHTMPPTLAQGTNQALLDTMVLRKALVDSSDVCGALRRYEKARRRRVRAVSWVTTQQVSRSEAALRPAALIPDRVMTWALTRFIDWTSHRDISAAISRGALTEVR